MDLNTMSPEALIKRIVKAIERVKANPSRRGGKTTLPNGEHRIDYIHRRFYLEGAARGVILKEVNAMLREAKRKEVPYQIVWAATTFVPQNWGMELQTTA